MLIGSTKIKTMGIKNLNKFLRSECKRSIHFISVSELSGKKIAVDISVYMYKFESDGNLIESIYLMLSIFRNYNIIPIFVFDGKPPTEKKELLQKRREDKKDAEEEYNKLKNQLKDNPNMDEDEKQEISNNMDLLKKQFIYMNKEKIESVKTLIRSYGCTYYDAPGEADELCAKLTIKNKVWGCLSEDMDMFVYGAPKILRYFSLLNHTMVLYDLKGILEELGISQKSLREICILSGTDYNLKENIHKMTLFNVLKLYKKYHKQKLEIGFYDWLNENTDYIDDYELLNKIYKMFDLSEQHDNLKIFDNIRIANGIIDKEEIRKILMTDGFIFPSDI